MIYLVAALMGLFFSAYSMVFAMTAGREAADAYGALLAIAHAGAIGFAISKARKGAKPAAAIALLSPAFLATGAMWMYAVGQQSLSLLAPDPPAFTASCATAGARYFSLPASPVRSIAYDWSSGAAPALNEFDLGFGTRLSAMAYSDPPYPESIAYIEKKGRDGRYLRIQRSGAEVSVPAPSADTLVQYKIDPQGELQKAPQDQQMLRYELTVTDRRTGQRLAFLRYIVDASRRRGCGLTSGNRISEREFVLKSIGLR